MKSSVRVALLLALALLAACGGAATTATAGPATVAYKANKADPAQVNVAKGQSVTWTNNDAVPHTVTAGKTRDAKTGKFSERIDPGKSATIKFDEAGTFDYVCELHGSMTGFSVVVK